MKQTIPLYLLVSAAVVLVTTSDFATSDSNKAVAGAFEKAGEGIVSTAKTVGAGLETAGKETGKAFETAGKEIGKVATTAVEQTKQGFEKAGDELKTGFETAGGKIKETAEKAGDVFKKMGEATQDVVVNKIYHQGLEQTVYEKGLKQGLWEEGLVNTVFKKGLVPAVGEVLLFSKIAAKMFRNWFGKKIHPDFCKNVPASLHNLPMVTDPQVQKEDSEGLIPYIIKYAPVVYLQDDEIYFPIWVTEWCTGPQTSIKTQQGQVVVPAGQVTMEAAYELHVQIQRAALTTEKQNLEKEKAQLLGTPMATPTTPAAA